MSGAPVLSRLISFADPTGGSYGSVAIEADGRAAAAVVHTAPNEAALTLDDATATRGEGTLRLEAAAGTLVLGLAARTTPLAFETGPDRSIEIQSIGVSASVSRRPSGGEIGFEGEGVAWAVSGEDDQGSIRTLWALGRDGLFAMFALRETAATHHASETVGAVRIAPDGAVLAYEEPLLSTEYDAAGRQTRATLELWGGNEGGMADRGGGKRLGGGGCRIGDADLEAASFAWTLSGRSGFGGYEIYKSA